MRERTELLKGILEGCVLETIGIKPAHGYEILRFLRETGFSDVAEGTVYAMLLRLEKNGLVRARAEKTHVGPQRRIFTLTEKGTKAREDFWRNWERLQEDVERLRKGDGNDRKSG